VLPLAHGSERGFLYQRFLADVPIRSEPAVIEAARVGELMRDALAFPPIDLQRGELVWLYTVHQNVEPGPPRHQYALFTNGQLEYRGNARFELSYWNYSNYAQVG
jgi:hypothetical protein